MKKYAICVLIFISLSAAGCKAKQTKQMPLIHRDGIGKAATFGITNGIVKAGNVLYVTDTHFSTIRKVDIPSATVTTIAGLPDKTGADDGIGDKALFNHPTGIACDGRNLYITDYGNNTIRKLVIATGKVTTLAGKAGSKGAIDGQGKNARFYKPTGIILDGNLLYVADYGNNMVRAVRTDNGFTSTLAGDHYFYMYTITKMGTSLFVANGDRMLRMESDTGSISVELGNTEKDLQLSSKRYSDEYIASLATDGKNLFMMGHSLFRYSPSAIKKEEIMKFSSPETYRSEGKFLEGFGMCYDSGFLYVARGHYVSKIDVQKRSEEIIAGTKTERKSED